MKLHLLQESKGSRGDGGGAQRAKETAPHACKCPLSVHVRLGANWRLYVELVCTDRRTVCVYRVGDRMTSDTAGKQQIALSWGTTLMARRGVTMSAGFY